MSIKSAIPILLLLFIGSIAVATRPLDARPVVPDTPPDGADEAPAAPKPPVPVTPEAAGAPAANPSPDEQAPRTQADEARDLVNQAALIWESRPDIKSRGPEIEGLLKQAIEKNPQLDVAYLDLALLYDRLGRDADAQYRIDQLLEIEPGHAGARALRGALMLRRGLRAEGMAELQAVLKDDPYNSIANNQIAAFAIAESRYEDAIRAGRLALLVDSGNMNAYTNIALAYMRMQKVSLAKLVCFNALSIDKKASTIYNILGLLYLGEDMVKEAIVEFEKAVQYQSDFFEAHMNLGAIMLNYSDFSGAMGHFDAALATHPETVEAVLSRAVALRGLGRYDEAARGYEKVLSLKAGHLGALYNRCILYQEYLNEYEKALGYCNNMLTAIDKKHPAWAEMNDRVRGIEQTIRVLKEAEEERKRLEEEARKAKEAAAAAPAGPTDGAGAESAEGKDVEPAEGEDIEPVDGEDAQNEEGETNP